MACQFLRIFYGPKEDHGASELGQKSPGLPTRVGGAPEVPPPQASVATRNQSRPSLAPCRRGPSSPEAMEEDPGGAIIAMKAKDQRENLSPSRGRPWRRKHKGENLSSSLSVAPECHREGNHRRGDRLHQHHHHHHHPHLFYAVHSPAPRCNPYLNMVLYATYYDPMMCCHPMMF